MESFLIYSNGFCYCSACSSYSLEETAEMVNEVNPTGLDHEWRLADEPFRDGKPNPCPCDRAPETHKHYLFSC